MAIRKEDFGVSLELCTEGVKVWSTYHGTVWTPHPIAIFTSMEDAKRYVAAIQKIGPTESIIEAIRAFDPPQK
jgi:hypothetical protein